MSAISEAPKAIRSTIPARLDRLSWSPFHTRMVGGAIMIFGGIVELLMGIKAERKSLEDITKPVTSTQGDAPGGGPQPAPAG